MSKFFIFFSIILISVTHNIQAQRTPIQTDRPDQTESPSIVPVNYFQAENGFTYEQVHGDEKNIVAPSILWKYGMNDRFELRVITEHAIEKDKTGSVNGIVPITVGCKANLCSEKKWIPMISFIGHVTSRNWGSKKYQTTYAAPSFRFTCQHTLSDQFSLGYNIGAEWNGETALPAYIYTLTTGCSLTDKFGGYVEVYGFIARHNTADHRVDGGFTWLLSNDFMIDISGGAGISKISPAFYVALGFSYRIAMKHK